MVTTLIQDFNEPCGICFNPHDDCLYICDTKNNVIKRVTKQGILKYNCNTELILIN